MRRTVASGNERRTADSCREESFLRKKIIKFKMEGINTVVFFLLRQMIENGKDKLEWYRKVDENKVTMKQLSTRT